MYSFINKSHSNTIADAFMRSVEKRTNKIGLVFKDRQWTYQQLEQAVNRVANHLLKQELKKGDRIAAYGKNSDAYLILWLACARSGLVHVPINFGLTSEELAYMVDQSGANALVYDQDLTENLALVRRQNNVVHYGCFYNVSDESLNIIDIAQSDSDASVPEVLIDENDIVQILYTSGTTAAPKGAIHTHRSLLTEYTSCHSQLDIKEGDRSLAALPLYHSAQMHVFVMPTLLMGGYTHLIDSPVPDTILSLLVSEKLNSFFAPPTLVIALLNNASFDQSKLQHINKIYYGASIMPEPIVIDLAKRLPKAGLYNCYGQSEIGPLATVLKPEDHQAKPGSIGKPLPSVRTWIVDPETGVKCQPNEHGEIVHQSPQLMTGYWDKPEETKGSFKNNWFYSGDLAYADEEGFIYIVDRIKDVINTGGVLVSSRNVEEIFYQHPSVAEVAVVGLPDSKWIEAITAFIVLKANINVTEQVLLAHASEHLASFKVPKKIHFVDSIPKNTAGKVLKRSLREQFG